MQSGQPSAGGPPPGSHTSSASRPAWLQRINTTLILILLLGGVGFAFRALSQRVAEDLPVPGIYVRVRTEGGKIVEARAAPPPAQQAAGPSVALDVTLADVATVVRLVEETARVRVALPCPIAQRVSLRVRGAPVDAALEAMAAAANLRLIRRQGTFVLNACPPPPPSP